MQIIKEVKMKIYIKLVFENYMIQNNMRIILKYVY